jgi:hypothetical protein
MWVASPDRARPKKTRRTPTQALIETMRSISEQTLKHKPCVFPLFQCRQSDINHDAGDQSRSRILHLRGLFRVGGLGTYPSAI